VVSKAGVGYECLIQGKNIRQGSMLYFGDLKASVLEVKRDALAPDTLLILTATGT